MNESIRARYVEGSQARFMDEQRRGTVVPVGPLRGHFIYWRGRGELTPSLVVRRLGWSRSDTSRVMRSLGIMPDNLGRYRQFMGTELAGKLCAAMGMDPYEAGL